MITKYKEKKIKNQVVITLAEKYTSDKTQKRLCECGDWIQSLADREASKMKVHQANFCKWRFCVTCMYRQAMKDAFKIGVMMDYIEETREMAFIFVTLTAPNVKDEALPEEVTRYNHAFKNLTKRDEIANMNQGYIRKLEITYNAKRNDYHTHLHVVFAVKPNYFKDRTYVKQDKWLNLWREVMKNELITQVDVRRVKRGGADGRGGDVMEFSKYVAKDSEYTISQEVFDTFYNALKGRQLVTYNGLFADANKMFKECLKAKKEGTPHVMDKYIKADKTEYFYMLMHRWGGTEYLEKARRELTAEEKEKLNGILMDEAEIEE
jgi:plasmid rolling circle replication initiator protein Rep